ncbi:MAG TPA: DJ-1/PfpI family protein [Candidatus Saccharimonadales bacterium]|nr:DJ-1/PfpI family protein [Candidatus Saccharimonadales bacterium]
MESKLKSLIRKRWILFGAAVAAILIVILVVLAPGKQSMYSAATTAVNKDEHMQTITEMGKPRHKRPVVAIVAFNQATEITDLVIPYGVLKRANVADVTIVAEKMTPVSLYPFSKLGQGSELFKIDPQASMESFDKQYPDGADYVIIPALEPRDDKVVVDWIKAQHDKGAHIVSVCAGALTLAATGLLDGRQATTHWAYIDDLKKAHPTAQIVRDQRYVADNGITTATGISASLPVTVALVAAIAGTPKAEQLAQDLGMAYWDERHRSSDFELTWEHKKTFMRNWVSFWRQETLGVPVKEGVDEIALALTVDAYSRTSLAKVLTMGDSDEPVRGKYGLMIYTNASKDASVKETLPLPDPDMPARTIDRVLEQIAERYGRPTADIVALTLEYPWMRRAK